MAWPPMLCSPANVSAAVNVTRSVRTLEGSDAVCCGFLAAGIG